MHSCIFDLNLLCTPWAIKFYFWDSFGKYGPKLTFNAVQIILANTRMYECTVELNIQLSQGIAATNVRGGGKFYSNFLYGSSRNTTVKELLKSVHICQSYPKNKTCTFFDHPRCSFIAVIILSCLLQ